MDESTARVVDARQKIEDLIPTPWDRNAFIEAVGSFRGRPIDLVAVPSTAFGAGELESLRGTPCGLWLSYDDRDEIAYDSGTSERQIDQIVGHEIGHMLLDHSGATETDLALRRLLPGLDLDEVKKVLGRSAYSDVQESEAELFADLLMSRVSKYRRSKPMDTLWGSE